MAALAVRTRARKRIPIAKLLLMSISFDELPGMSCRGGSADSDGHCRGEAECPRRGGAVGPAHLLGARRGRRGGGGAAGSEGHCGGEAECPRRGGTIDLHQLLVPLVVKTGQARLGVAQRASTAKRRIPRPLYTAVRQVNDTTREGHRCDRSVFWRHY